MIGGSKAKPGMFPSLVQLMIIHKDGEKTICGGLLVSQDLVMTIGKCTYNNPSFIEVRLGLGSANGKPDQSLVASHVCTPKSRLENPESSKLDVVVIKLPKNVRYNEFVYPACILFNSSVKNKYYIGVGLGSEKGEQDITQLRYMFMEESCDTQIVEYLHYNQRTCYRAKYDEGNLCIGDLGTPIYDGLESEFGRGQYAKGLASTIIPRKACESKSSTNHMYSDFDKLQELIIKLLNQCNDLRVGPTST